jgi:hypothetical protein
MAQKNLDTAPFPPMTNDWGTKELIPDMVPPVMAE